MNCTRPAAHAPEGDRHSARLIAVDDLPVAWNVGSGRQTTVTEMHSRIGAVLDRSSPPCSGAGWKATVDLAEGIQRTISRLFSTPEPEPAATQDA